MSIGRGKTWLWFSNSAAFINAWAYIKLSFLFNFPYFHFTVKIHNTKIKCFQIKCRCTIHELSHIPWIAKCSMTILEVTNSLKVLCGGLHGFKEGRVWLELNKAGTTWMAYGFNDNDADDCQLTNKFLCFESCFQVFTRMFSFWLMHTAIWSFNCPWTDKFTLYAQNSKS